MGLSNSIGSYNHDLKTTATVTSLPPEVLLKTFHMLATNAEKRWIRYLKHGPLPLDPANGQEEAVSPAEESSSLMAQLVRFAPTGATHNIHPSPYVWIRLTHVCRAWRDMALSTSTLWTHVALVSEEAMMEILRRSGEQPLTVTARMAPPYVVPRLSLMRHIFT